MPTILLDAISSINNVYRQEEMKIKRLKIFTSILSEQKEFYQNILGLSLVYKAENSCCFQVGDSQLILEYKAGATPYHYAINIPSNKEKEALNWLKSRLDILLDNEREIQHFDSWNARAIYFYDKDKNIVEFIARKNLDNKSDNPFDQNSLLEISEIGMPTIHIHKQFEVLHSQIGIGIYDGGFERFCAIGDEYGLFICIDKTAKNWYPTNDPAHSSDFEALVKYNSLEFELHFKNGTLRVHKHHHL
jgi:catechol-2,3-dioxygenase